MTMGVVGEQQPGRRGLTALREHLSAPLFRNAYFLILSSTLTSLLGLPFWALAARNYSAADVGRASAIISALALISGFAQLGMTSVFPRYLPGAGSRTVRFVLGTYGATLLLSLALGITAALTSSLWAPPLRFLGDDSKWFVLFVVMTAASTISGLQDSVMTGLHEARWVPVENVIFGLAKIALVVVFASDHPHAGVVLAWMVPLIVLLVPVNLATFARFIPTHLRSTTEVTRSWTARDVRRLILGSFPGEFASLVIAYFLPILVVDLVGPRKGAYFYVPWTISIGMRFIAQNLATSMTVEVGFSEAKRREHLRDVSIGTFRLLIPALALVLIAGPYVLGVFGHRYDIAGSGALRLLALGTIPHAISQLGLGLARVRHDGRFVGIVQSTDAVVMLALSAVLVPSIGIAGAGLAWLVAQSVAATINVPSLWRALRGPIAPAQSH
jgi:O-antigen/teichoic acid export membrane protein